MWSNVMRKSGNYAAILFKYFNMMDPTSFSNYSTYPNVVVSMLERHLGNFLKKNLGEVWLNTPKTIGPIQRSGDGGQFKEWSNKLIDDIVGNPR